MKQTLPLIPSDDIPEGKSAEVVAEGRVFAVFNIRDKFYVLDGMCPHAGGPLGQGTLQGCIVTCPWHGWQFDVTTGQHQLSDGICQPGYDAAVVDGMVVIRLDE
ncbi:MAG: Rieske 2Fe-2S domain-containing protein [Fuerstiella sp.]|nr:Rieske 2Fe-2S domain-containing protein [Fuerstiella sp.]